jgi:hypothetical protein
MGLCGFTFHRGVLWPCLALYWVIGRQGVREASQATLSIGRIMKRLFDAKLITVATMIMTGLDIACAQETNATKEIEMTVERYFTAMSARDVGNM